MSDREWERQLNAPFHFNLQRFGHHHGKGGKVFASVLGAILGCMNPVMFGLARAAHLAGAVMGASLFGSIWSATSKQSGADTGSADVSRFDRAQETMSSDGQIPVVYGMRQIAGNQTFHQTNADANTLHKHVILCEGGIEGVVSVTANDKIIPTGNQNSHTVFTVINNKYPDARVRKSGQDFDLWAGENHHHIHLCTKGEIESSHNTYWEYQVSVSALISYINQLYSEGWQAFPVASTNNYPGDLYDVSGAVYTRAPSNIFGHFRAWRTQVNYVPVDASQGFVNFCASTVRGGTNYKFHDCEPPDNYEVVGGYPSMAWLDMNFIVSNELNGNPSISAVVMGKKVYDIRTKTTAYSTNPAMCLRDFMLSERYGLGKWIKAEDLDDDSWAKAADYCDEEISFLDASGATIRAKRFELNMVIDQKNDAIEWLKEILANFQAYLTLSNGKFKLHIEQRADVCYKFNDDNCFDLSVAPLSLNETPNKYDVKIIDPRNNWSAVSCVVEDYADQKERQKVITKEVNLNGTTSQYQALRLARFYRDQNLACPLNISFKTGIQAMHLEPGDVVTVSYHDVFTELPIRIMSIKQNEEGNFEIAGRQYNETIYGDSLGGGVHWYNYTDTTQTVAKRIPSNPTNLKAYTQYRRYEDGTTGYAVICSYELPQRYDVETGLVYYRTNHMTAAQIGTFKEGEIADSVGLSREWIYAGDSPTKVIVPNAKVGDIYEFRVQSRTNDGLISSESSAPTVTVKVTAKETVPSQPYNLVYDFTKAFTFKWNDVPDSDVMYYEVRTDTNTGSPVGLLGKTQSTSLDVNLMERNGTVYVYSVNTLKKYSYPAKVTYNYPKPDAPSYIHFTEALRGVNVLVAPFPARVKSMRLYVEGHGISKSFDLDNASYTFSGEPYIYDFWASYVDMMGEGYTSAKYSYTIKPEMNPEWLKDEAISLKKVDKEIQDAVKDAQQALPTLNEKVAELTKTDEEIKATVQDKTTKMSSQIKQNADSITSVVANLSDLEKAKSNYSAIAQLQDNINLIVKNDDIINQINISKESILIDGNKVHITGDTKFDNNVITGGMIAAGAITADKLSASTINLAGNQGISGGNVTLDANGMTVTKNAGGGVLFNGNGMQFFDKNNAIYSTTGRIIVGTIRDGQSLKFNSPWDNIPCILMSPVDLASNLGGTGYGSANVSIQCLADNVSVNGFTCRCRTLATNANGGTNTTCLGNNSVILKGAGTAFTSAVITINVSAQMNELSPDFYGIGTRDYYATVVTNIYVNGTVKMSLTSNYHEGVWRGAYNSSSWTDANNTSLSGSLWCNPNDTITASCSITRNDRGFISNVYANISLNYHIDSAVLCTGSAMFIAVESPYNGYTIA